MDDSEGLDRSFGPGWEDGTPRTVTGGYLRTSRLTALGNAVVPSLVRVICEAILAVEAMKLNNNEGV